MSRPAAPSPSVHQATAPPPAPSFAPAVLRAPVTATQDANGKPILFNDPSAPADTPLCGSQAREANAIGAAILGGGFATSGVCASFACFNPLTATYIGADGDRHVCR